MTFLLDTDTCIFVMKGDIVAQRELRALRPEDVALSVVTEAELRTGARKSRSPGRTQRLLELFLRPLAVLDFTSSDAEHYASVRASLEKRGTPIGALDTLIAAHAVSRGLVLVTNNVREFRCVPGLRTESWARP